MASSRRIQRLLREVERKRRPRPVNTFDVGRVRKATLRFGDGTVIRVRDVRWRMNPETGEPE